MVGVGAFGVGRGLRASDGADNFEGAEADGVESADGAVLVAGRGAEVGECAALALELAARGGPSLGFAVVRCVVRRFLLCADALGLGEVGDERARGGECRVGV